MLSDDDAVAALQAAITFPTTAGAHHDAAAFAGLRAELERRFARVFAGCERVDLGDAGGEALLLRWPGRTSNEPLVLMAHQDVVPVADDAWQHPPYGGETVEGFIWGRGSVDCKGSLVAILAAVERLMGEGFVPAHDVWLSFGADEEVMGRHAGVAVSALRDRGVEPWLVLDEGGAVADDAFPGITRPLAVIGVAEKGTVDLRLVAHGDGGHASTPKPGGTTAQIARAITALEKAPAPARVGDATVAMLEAMVPVAPRAMRPLLARARDRRVQGALAHLFPRLGPEAAAMVHTTRAVTMLEGSPARNVIATQASANVNMRVAVAESVAEAVALVQKTVGEDVAVEVLDASEPSPVSPSDDEQFEVLRAVTRRTLPDAHVVPYVMNQATDARHFHRVWPHVYRFTPFRLSRAQRESLHNADERLGVDSFIEGIGWYRALIEAR